MTVHFVGAGPGAADLLTVRAARCSATADVVLYPGTYLDEAARPLPRGRASWSTPRTSTSTGSPGAWSLPHRAGLDVVRLVSGDPSVYSALTEQTRRLDEAGVPWDVTPGVPAYAAAAALRRASS